MNAHTPGPWHVSAGSSPGNPRVIVESDAGLPVCALSLRGVQGDTRRMEANARLIAAAPTMYEYIASSASNGCAEARKIMEAINAGH